jgi:hypothetical protein
MGNPISITTLSGSTPTWDAIYKFAKITATSNVAITLSGAGTPDGGILHFVQDGTGSRTLSINGTSITVKTAASSVTRVDWAFDGTNYTYYPYLDGVSGTETITPAAPTGGVVDDTANTFTFTLNPSYAASEHEYQIGAGSWTACSSNVISVGNVAISIGDLKVRVSADTGRNASSNLTNATAFTVSGGVTTLFLDNFTGAAGALSGHTPDTGTRNTIYGSPTLDGSGKLSISGTDGFAVDAVADTKATAVIDTASLGEGDNIIIYARLGANYIKATLQITGGNGILRIVENIGGSETNYGESSPTPIASLGNTMEFTIDGTTATVVMGTASAGGTITVTTPGLTALALDGGSVLFDSFKIETV